MTVVRVLGPHALTCHVMFRYMGTSMVPRKNIAYLHDEVVQKNEYPLKYYKTAGKTPGLTSLGVEYVLIRICGYLW